jgi:hypothetical protein
MARTSKDCQRDVITAKSHRNGVEENVGTSGTPAPARGQAQGVKVLLVALTVCSSLTTAGCQLPATKAKDAAHEVVSDSQRCSGPCQDPSKDEDNDGIPNGEEGCLVCRDSDGDKVPDWKDYDSDDDGIFDDIERGGASKCKIAHAKGKGWPCDTDGDGTPDYLDSDSDDDGLLDACEDYDGDGQLGCCLTICNKLSGRQSAYCMRTETGCGQSQTCSAGTCTPTTTFECSAGETDRLRKVSFGDGRSDSARGTHICHDPGGVCNGTRPVLRKYRSYTGRWNIAYQSGASFAELALQQPGTKRSAAAVDYRGSKAEVAGFVLSRVPNAGTLMEIAQSLQAELSRLPAAPDAIKLVAWGRLGKAPDCNYLLAGMTVELRFASGCDLSSLRNELLEHLLESKLKNGEAPKPFGIQVQHVVLRLALVLQYEHMIDSSGSYIDDQGLRTTLSGKCAADTGDAAKRRLIVTGAVADRERYRDVLQDTRVVADDLTNGTAVAVEYIQSEKPTDWKTVERCQAIEYVAGKGLTVALRGAPCGPFGSVSSNCDAISASLVVAVDGVKLPRSRYKGFDYSAPDNSIVFYNVNNAPGSKVLVSYAGWFNGWLE